MKQKHQRTLRVLSFVMALVMVLSLVPAAAVAADAPTKLYLKPNSNWLKDNARFAVYYFGNGDGWASMSDRDGDGVYEGTIPSGYPNVIFCRMNPGTGDNNWDNKWNQTGDLTVPTNGNNCFTVLDGSWDGATSSWSYFEPTYIIAGDSTAVFGTAWDVSNTSNKMTRAANGIYEKTYVGVAPGTYSFKVTAGTWNCSWGGNGPDGNYVFTLQRASDVTILFDEVSETITVDIVTQPVKDVTIHYRNTGMWADIYYHAWTENGDNDQGLTSWPGLKLAENTEHKNWYTVELKGLNAANGIGILFHNGGGSQTADLMIDENGEYWYDGGLLTEAPDTWHDGTVPTVSYSATLHFADAKNWGHVNLYTWTNTGTPTGPWPGTALTQDEDGFYTMTVEYEAPMGQPLNFIFSGNGQTVDLKLDNSCFVEQNGVYTAEKWVAATGTNDEGKFYAELVDAPEAIAISPQIRDNAVTFQYKNADASKVEVFGSWDNWASGIDMVKNHYGVWSVTKDFDYGMYEYKFVVNGTDWVRDELNSWITGKDQNSAFLISDPAMDTNTVNINIHYTAPSVEWNVCAWGARDLAPQYDFVDGVATITLDGRANQYVAFKIRKSIEGNDWAEQSGEIRVDLSNTVSGTIDVWVNADFSVSQSLNADVVHANKVKSVELDYDNNTIVIQTVKAVKDVRTAFAVWQDGVMVDVVEDITFSGGAYILNLNRTLELVDLYRYRVAFLEDINEAYRGGLHVIGTNTVYASDKFADEFTYDGELGALWTKEATTFRVWAPTASAVSLKLYASGTEKTDDLINRIAMTAGEDGTWSVTVRGDLNGIYYTYEVTVDGTSVEAVDPYARTTGVNGKRGMVIDLDSTDPEGWAEDCNPNPIEKYSDAVVYELHVRDFSIDDSSGISEANRGKYLAFTEEGTTTANGAVTGIDYLEDLGITHLHLLPVYDYGSVDETKCENFNWGYDPVNYNTPEGSYSTNPYNGEVRVKEFKEMVLALHEADISVIMDVVYNHVYDAGKFCMNQIVPKYFSRVNADGSYSNSSGCGNDTASEREMVRKYIVESIMYWKEEYHIDGFRFDLVGLLDADTINEIVNTVHAKYPDVIFYGEGWTMGTAVEPGNTMATQANSKETPEFAYFSDTIRNLLAGSNGSSLGFVSGQAGQEEAIRDNFLAQPWWSDDPQQIVQYASCHDNYTLVDKLILSTGKSKIDGDIIRMNNLAAAIYMTSQGIPFIHAGEEFLREKIEEDGGRCENSYNASDFVNHIEWSNLEDPTYAANSEYYKGLIEFRKAHESLRLETRAEIDANIDYTWVTNEVVMFTIDADAAGDISDSIVVIFNANNKAAEVNLPAGEWSICINNTTAGTEVIGTAESSVSVAGISAMVLVQGETALPHEHAWTYTDNGNGTHTAVCDCGERETVQHSFVDDECACGFAVNVAKDNNGVFYDTLSQALAAAGTEEGERTIVVMHDCTESNLVVPANVALDLNGHVVTAENFLAFGTVVDGQSEAGGIRISADTKEAFTKLQPDNGGYLPIYDTDAGMYRFFKYELRSAGYMSGENSVKFGFRILFENMEAYGILADSTNAGVGLTIHLQWDGMSVPSIPYQISEATLRNYAAEVARTTARNSKVLMIGLYGLNNLSSGDSIKANAVLDTIAEVTGNVTEEYCIP